jgi:hypothetical protein
MANPSRGRIALPPLHDEGDAFVAGGGEDTAPASATTVKKSGKKELDRL